MLQIIQEKSFFDDKSDIITLVQYNLYAKHKEFTTWEAIKSYIKFRIKIIVQKRREKTRENRSVADI